MDESTEVFVLQNLNIRRQYTENQRVTLFLTGRRTPCSEYYRLWSLHSCLLESLLIVELIL
jgi:hypothetical protein